MDANRKKIYEINNSLDKLYGELVVEKIRKQYSQNDEFAILRQRDDKPEEFEAYNAFVEACKDEAYVEVYGENRL